MPRRTTDADRARGERILEIREQVPDRSQEAFAAALTKAAKAIGLPVNYRYYTVSRMEGGSISFEDAAIALSLDKKKRGWDWFVFGDTIEMPVKHFDKNDLAPAVTKPDAKRGRGGG